MARGSGGGAFKSGGNTLTNNFHANMAFLAVVDLCLLGLWLTGEISTSDEFYRHLLVANASYFLTSMWFSPDLDIRENRPGKHRFPLKWAIEGASKLKKKVPFGRGILTLVATALTPVHLILNRAWRLLWEPFAALFTHRGAVHWPVIGTQFKIVYLYVVYWLVSFGLGLLGQQELPGAKAGLVQGIESFYEWILVTPLAKTAWIAMMTADFCHSAIDAWDSWKKGSKFVPPAAIAPRGLINQALSVVAGLIRWMARRLGL